jgi:hypothetical protein
MDTEQIDIAAERSAIRIRRRDAARVDGPFVKAMRSAMDDYLKMRAAGVSKEDACRGLEAVLRDVWPFKQTQYPATCEVCSDTGFRELTCWSEQRCGRKWCAHQHPSFEHNMVVPCDCAGGDKHRARVRQVDDEIAAVGRSRRRKAGGWTPVGR